MIILLIHLLMAIAIYPILLCCEKIINGFVTYRGCIVLAMWSITPFFNILLLGVGTTLSIIILSRQFHKPGWDWLDKRVF